MARGRNRWGVGRRLLAGLGAALVVAACGLATIGTSAAIDPDSVIESIRHFDVDLRIEASGTLRVQETIEYNFGVVPRHGIYRDIPTRFDYPAKADTDRVTPLDGVSITATRGASAKYESSTLSQDGVGFTRLKIGDANKTISGVVTYTITYRVRGAIDGFPDHDALVWNATGNGWTVPILATTVKVEAPADVQSADCWSGYTGAKLPCTAQKASGSVATFAQGRLDAGQGVTFALSLPPGSVAHTKPILEERWTVGRAFALTPVTGGVAAGLLVLLVGGFAFLFVRVARDRRYRGGAVDQAFGVSGAPEERLPLVEHTETPVEFVPPDGIRPGQVGTLVDFAANPLDVSATIVDLAVRRYLTITEIEAEHGGRDWTLTRLAPEKSDLRPYEQKLLDALFQDGSEVALSSLRQHFATRMHDVEAALMGDALEQGWFRGRPGTVRALAYVAGVLVLGFGLFSTVVLAASTHAGLIGIPVVVLGIVMLACAHLAPARTAKGHAVLRRVDGFRRFIDESEQPRADFAERTDIFSEYLPYAIVFGATDRWAKRFAGLADGLPAETSWYVSSRPFEILAFSSAMNSFTVTTAGTLTSVPPSTSGGGGGFGGGFSGGGFGGGGGGSW